MTAINTFIDQLLDTARRCGVETAEVSYSEGASFSVKAMGGRIDSYEVSSSSGLSLRGTVGAKMGYATTSAFDSEAIGQLVEAVKESAALNEAEDQDEIYAGDEHYPQLEAVPNDLSEVNAESKIQLALSLEKLVLGADPRIAKTEGAVVDTTSGTTILRNSMGLNLQRSDSVYTTYVMPIAKDGSATATGFALSCGRELKKVNADDLAGKAVREVLSQLHAEPVPSGEYRVILRYDAMQSLLATFSGIFSADNAQQHLSLLAGKEGEAIASPAVTLMDDPLLKGGFASSPFDDEGSATRTKAVIDHGVLTTLLHNRRTAKKAGVVTTGNARKAGSLLVAPTNFFFRPGEKDLAAMLKEMDHGLLITDISGTHAGANPISGDFSLLSKGFVVRAGELCEPVERITIAGNFYQVLKSILAVGSDLEFPGRGIGSPSVDVGTLSVSGK